MPTDPLTLTDADLRAIEHNARAMRAEVFAIGFRALFRSIAGAVSGLFGERRSARA